MTETFKYILTHRCHVKAAFTKRSNAKRNSNVRRNATKAGTCSHVKTVCGRSPPPCSCMCSLNASLTASIAILITSVPEQAVPTVNGCGRRCSLLAMSSGLALQSIWTLHAPASVRERRCPGQNTSENTAAFHRAQPCLRAPERRRECEDATERSRTQENAAERMQ